MKKTFFIKTLGCKVNQVESAFIAEKLLDKRFVLASEKDAQIMILNSCVVTAKAQAECRKIIKRWNKFSPEFIILAGCYSQRFFNEASAWAKENNIINLLILGQKEKFKISVDSIQVCIVILTENC